LDGLANLPGAGRSKALQKIESGLPDLQAIENAENHQGMAWKNLAEKAFDLETLGKNAWKKGL